MVDVALFELEGVLFDTAELRQASMRDALARRGLLPESYEQTLAADRVLADLVALDASRAFSSELARRGAALQPGARELVASAASSARLAVVTRGTRSDADTLLRLAGLEDLFTVIVTADDVLDAKPHPAPHRTALERLARNRVVAPGAALALEHDLDGIRAARAAALRCIAVGDMPAYVALEADAYVATLEGQTLRSLDLLSLPGQEHVQ